MPIPSPASPTPPGTPGAAPAPAPIGGSPATQPTPNRGYEMAGKQKLAMAIKAVEEALPLFGAGSEEGQQVLKALQILGKIAQPGDTSPAGEQNGLQKMLMAAIQRGAQQKQMAKPPGGAPGGPPGGAPPAQAAA